MVDELLRETVFELPGGLSLSDGRRVDRVRLRPLTGHEEDWLAHQTGAPGAVAVSAILGGCLIHAGDAPAGRDLARRLLAGDRDFLMLQLRRLTLGDRVQAVLDCPSCSGKIDVEFDAGAVPVEGGSEPPASEYAAGSRSIRFRLPTGEDQEAVAGLPVEQAADQLLKMCLLDEGAETLSEAERAEVVDEMERLAPRVELELDIHCPECNHEFLAPFDMTAFFFQEIRLKRERLLREIHTLALYYHWSESEILSLTRPRRRAYLELLSDSTRVQ